MQPTIVPSFVPVAQPVQMAVPVTMAETVPMAMPVVDTSALETDAKIREAEAKIREAEQRARQAEAAVRLQEAEMRARAAEQALAQQARMAALEKALRDAMPGWFSTWTERSTASLQTAIAQAEAAAPPAGSSLHSALLEAKEALRGQLEAKAKKEAEERAKREAEEKARREAEERARREAEEKARREAEEKKRDLSGMWYSYYRAGDPNHSIDNYEFVWTGSKYKIMRGGENGDGDQFAVHGSTIHHDHGITATIQSNGDIFWHFENEQYASRRSVPECTLVSHHSAEQVVLEPSVTQALRSGQVTPLLLSSPAGYAIVPKMANPERINEWGVAYQHLGIGPAEKAMKVRMQGVCLVSQHPTSFSYHFDVPFGVFEVNCHGEHGPLPIAAIHWDDQSANLNAGNTANCFQLNADNTISPTAATHLVFGRRGTLAR